MRWFSFNLYGRLPRILISSRRALAPLVMKQTSFLVSFASSYVFALEPLNQSGPAPLQGADPSLAVHYHWCRACSLLALLPSLFKCYCSCDDNPAYQHGLETMLGEAAGFVPTASSGSEKPPGAHTPQAFHGLGMVHETFEAVGHRVLVPKDLLQWSPRAS